VSASPLIQAIQARLALAGYSVLPTPFRIAGVEFAFTGALRGRDGRALDLILLIDTTTGDFGDRDPARVRQRIEALSRALDVTGSRYVVTAILAGAVLAEGIETLSETCRVLQVDGIALNAEGEPVDAVTARQLDDRIRVLLPLTLPEAVTPTQDGSASAIEQLTRVLPTTTNPALVEALIAGSENGEQAVTDAAALVISGAFTVVPGEIAP